MKINSFLRFVSVFTMSTTFVYAQGSKTGGWMQHLGNNWYSLGWHGGQKENNVTRSWSGDNNTFTGQGGWFSSTWGSEGGNWLPDISRSGSGFGALTRMVPNYNVQWTGTGSITLNNSNYTFGLKFNAFSTPGWVDYDRTSSFECYIITHTNKTSSQMGRFIGTVYPEGDPVGYDCYVYDANWQPHGEFIQLWAFRRENSWSDPVNVRDILQFWEANSGTTFNNNAWQVGDMSIMIETFDTAGTFRVDNIQIPDFETALPLVQSSLIMTVTAPVIDGNHDIAWANASPNIIGNPIMGTVSSVTDLAGNWRGIWDAQNLYLLVNVTDDIKFNDSNAQWWEDDLVEIYIDANNSKNNSYDGVDDYQYVFRWNDPAVLETKLSRIAGVTFARVDTATGYQLEIRFPWSTLGLTPEAGSVIGLEIMLNDDDNGGTRERKLAWHGTSDTAWQNPSLFGVTELAPPIGTGNGLQGEYYDNIDFTGTLLTRTDATANFNWLVGSPDTSMAVDTFSVRWTGLVQPRFSESYTFSTTTDDGVRLWVNGQLLIDQWVNQAPTEWSGVITLIAGQTYDIRLDYFEGFGGAQASLSWASASQNTQIIPQTQLYSRVSGNTFSQWIILKGLTGLNAKPAGDPDADGVPNLLEFALGSEPLAALSATLPRVQVVGNNVQISFTPVVFTGLTYIIQASSDLFNWTDTDVTSSLTLNQVFTYTDTQALSTSGPSRRFLRLHVNN